MVGGMAMYSHKGLHMCYCVCELPWQDKGGDNAPARANELEVLAIRNQKL